MGSWMGSASSDPSGYFLRNLSAGMVTVISRRLGLRKLASAKIAAEITPAITPTTVRKPNKLGILGAQAAKLTIEIIEHVPRRLARVSGKGVARGSIRGLRTPK